VKLFLLTRGRKVRVNGLCFPEFQLIFYFIKKALPQDK